MSSVFRTAAYVFAIRHLGKNGFTGPVLANITPLTRLVGLYAPRPPLPPCGFPADRASDVVAQAPC